MLEENYSRVQFGRASRAWERFRALAESTRIFSRGQKAIVYYGNTSRGPSELGNATRMAGLSGLVMHSISLAPSNGTIAFLSLRSVGVSILTYAALD